jgi:hypothetical protein
MNDKFDQMTKDLAQSVTRRGALKRFSLGLAGFALASLGLIGKTEAAPLTAKTFFLVPERNHSFWRVGPVG